MAVRGKGALPPYDEVMGGEGGSPLEEALPEAPEAMEAPAFYSTDPEVEARAAEAIVTGPGGGICEGCVHFQTPDQCLGFGGDLRVDAGQIVDCQAFRPTLGGEEGMMPPMGGGGLPPMIR